MMIVRYPSGIAVTYNDALYLEHNSGGTWVLRKSSNGDPIAFIQASAGAVVEFVPACKVEQSALTTRAAAERLSRSDAELKALPGRVLKDLKTRLRRFNSRSWSWK